MGCSCFLPPLTNHCWLFLDRETCPEEINAVLEVASLIILRKECLIVFCERCYRRRKEVLEGYFTAREHGVPVIPPMRVHLAHDQLVHPTREHLRMILDRCKQACLTSMIDRIRRVEPVLLWRRIGYGNVKVDG